MRRLIWGFAGHTYHIDGNLMLWLISVWTFVLGAHKKCLIRLLQSDRNIHFCSALAYKGPLRICSCCAAVIVRCLFLTVPWFVYDYGISWSYSILFIFPVNHLLQGLLFVQKSRTGFPQKFKTQFHDFSMINNVIPWLFNAQSPTSFFSGIFTTLR